LPERDGSEKFAVRFRVFPLGLLYFRRGPLRQEKYPCDAGPMDIQFPGYFGFDIA